MVPAEIRQRFGLTKMTRYNLAVIVSLSLLLASNAHASAASISDISSGEPGATSARIVWKTDAPATYEVLYGPTPSYGLSVVSSDMTSSHAVTILGLTRSTTYHFAVASTDSGGRRSISEDHVVSTSAWAAIGLNAGGQGYYFNHFAFLGDDDLAFMQRQGVSTIRIPICWEEMQPTLNGPLNPAYLSRLKSFLDAAAQRGIRAIVDIHGYARYQSKGNVDAEGNLIGAVSRCLANSTGYLIGSPQVPISAFADLWSLLASTLAGAPGVAGYELMNEPHDMGDLTTWPAAAEAAIKAIRTVDPRTPIYVPGNHWQDATGWASQNPRFPLNNPDDTHLIYAAHAYFDPEGGAYQLTYDQIGADPEIGVRKYRPFVTWLRKNKVEGAATEFGAPYDDPRWVLVMKNVMAYLKSNNMLGIVHYYDTSQPGYASSWPIHDPPGSLLNAAPVGSSGQLEPDRANPWMSLIRHFSLAQ
jgi:endoglucanase